MSVGLTLTMLIPQESVHVFKKGFLHQLTLPSCSVLPSLLAAPVMLEKILESPLDSKEIQPFHPKGNWS